MVNAPPVVSAAVSVNVVPVVLTGFMMLSSAFNSDAKALVWIVPLIGLMGILYYFDKACSMVPTVLSPMMSTFFIAYTLGYIAAPMAVHEDWNFMAIAAFLVLLALDVMTMKSHKCMFGKQGWINVAKGSLIGLTAGVGMYFAADAIGMAKHLYYTMSNKSMYCSKPKEQEMKCFVYKNGSMITAL